MSLEVALWVSLGPSPEEGHRPQAPRPHAQGIPQPLAMCGSHSRDPQPVPGSVLPSLPKSLCAPGTVLGASSPETHAEAAPCPAPAALAVRAGCRSTPGAQHRCRDPHKVTLGASRTPQCPGGRRELGPDGHRPCDQPRPCGRSSEGSSLMRSESCRSRTLVLRDRWPVTVWEIGKDVRGDWISTRSRVRKELADVNPWSYSSVV